MTKRRNVFLVKAAAVLAILIKTLPTLCCQRTLSKTVKEKFLSILFANSYKLALVLPVIMGIYVIGPAMATYIPS